MIQKLQEISAEILKSEFDLDQSPDSIIVNHTNDDIEGDFTIVLFPFVKRLGKNPNELGAVIGDKIVSSSEFVSGYNILKGFLNISLSDAYYIEQLGSISNDAEYGREDRREEKIMVEYCSPNTNKPIHLGHVRNILLGWSMSQIFDELGYEVIKTQIVNNRGIAICKSMVAWQQIGEGKTPESTSTKGDHFVGQYYVEFEKLFKAEYADWQKSDVGQRLFSENEKEDESEFFKGYKNKYFNDYSALGKKAKDMLIQWEAGDEDTISLWKKMNDWVYSGFESTYQSLGIHFDKNYYESDTYLLGKDFILQGVEDGVFYRKEDGSVWIDLEKEKLDHKLVLRSDGTSVYMTQDIGTAEFRYNETGAERVVYVVAVEQDYHFKVLFAIMKKLGKSYADGLFHLSYGMVELPDGKMKSREGTIVDADDLIAEIVREAKLAVKERGELHELPDEKQSEIVRQIALAALKFFILRVTAKKRIVFDPKESLDMQGQTGPYIQNAYVRIASIMRKHDGRQEEYSNYLSLEKEERVLIKELVKYPSVLEAAAANYDPSLLANYCYGLAKMYHRFYHEVRILSAESEEAKGFRLTLSAQVAKVLKRAMYLMGMEMPEKM